ncbi:MAG TPA: GNAT family N-acetyltransferase, partial [Gammaproteobacteria bacterium]|nr:GNAT family N-acetyltransferase [Gammaproteobacteria bacterium]
ALYPLDDTAAELACLAVHPDYRGQGRGDALLQYLERQAVDMGIRRLFVLSTKTSHWFRERGFAPAEPRTLPAKRQAMYNYRRNSKVFVKALGGCQV